MGSAPAWRPCRPLGWVASDQLRGDLYRLLAPYSGTQVGCSAWVAYCGAIDYYLDCRVNGDHPQR